MNDRHIHAGVGASGKVLLAHMEQQELVVVSMVEEDSWPPVDASCHRWQGTLSRPPVRPLALLVPLELQGLAMVTMVEERSLLDVVSRC